MQRISCPHCGHHVLVEVDTTSGDQDYYEDCAACCNPIHLNMHIDREYNKVELHIDNDNESVSMVGDLKKGFSKMKVDDLRALVVTKNLTDNDNSQKMKKNELIKMLQSN